MKGDTVYAESENKSLVAYTPVTLTLISLPAKCSAHFANYIIKISNTYNAVQVSFENSTLTPYTPAQSSYQYLSYSEPPPPPSITKNLRAEMGAWSFLVSALNL